jgi:hypothetical protein
MRQYPLTPRTPETCKASMHEHNADRSSDGKISRRRFLTSSAAGFVAGALATGTLAGTALAADRKSKGSGRVAAAGAVSCWRAAACSLSIPTSATSRQQTC